MDFVSSQIKMTAAGMRMAGFLIERNLRVAQVLGRAAIESSRIGAGVKIKTTTSAAKSVEALKSSKKVAKKASTPSKMPSLANVKAARPAAAASVTPIAAKPAPVKKPVPAKVAKPAVAKTSKSAPAKSEKAVAVTPSPKKTPKSTSAKPSVMIDATPKTTATAEQPPVTPKKTKLDAAIDTPVVARKAQPLATADDAAHSDVRKPRQPSAPPPLPKASSKVSVKADSVDITAKK